MRAANRLVSAGPATDPGRREELLLGLSPAGGQRVLMPEFEPKDPVELRIRGEYVDIVGLLAKLSSDFFDTAKSDDQRTRPEKIVSELVEQSADEVNFGLARKQLKRIVRSDESFGFRGLDVRIHEFDPRHPDEDSELDVNRLPPFEEAEAYVVTLKDDDGFYMAGYPDRLDPDMALELASALRVYARDLESVLDGDPDGA